MELTKEASKLAARRIYAHRGGLTMWEHVALETLKAVVAGISHVNAQTGRPTVFTPDEAVQWGFRFADAWCEALAQRAPEHEAAQARAAGVGPVVIKDLAADDRDIGQDEDAGDQIPDSLPTTGG